MSIIVDGFKVIKQNNGDVVLRDYQVTSNNKVTICEIKLGEKRNKFLCCYHGTSTMLEAIHKKDWLGCDSDELSQDAIDEKWQEYVINNACLYNDDYACLSF